MAIPSGPAENLMLYTLENASLLVYLSLIDALVPYEYSVESRQMKMKELIICWLTVLTFHPILPGS